MTTWDPHTQSVNVFMLDDKPSPGICKGFTGAAIKRKLDERSGYGIDRSFLVYTGRELAAFSTELLLITPGDWQYWRETFQPMIAEVPQWRGSAIRGLDEKKEEKHTAKEPSKAHLIWHPQLFALGITQCLVERECQETIDEFLIGHVVIDFRQVVYIPKAAYAKPVAPTQDPPLTEDQKEIKGLTNHLASLRQANEMAGK